MAMAIVEDKTFCDTKETIILNHRKKRKRDGQKRFINNDFYHEKR